jgi:hypothetical protein
MIAGDLDRDLDRLRTASDRINTNLLELEQHPTTSMLDAAPLQGSTKAQWQEARALLAELFQWNTLLGALIAEATSLRGSRATLSSTRAAELAALLRGPSIELEDSTVPLAARGLLSPSRAIERCTPDELLDRMAAAFDQVTRLVVAVTEAWDALVARVQATRGRVAELESVAEALGCGPPEGLDALRAALDDIADLVLVDPLTASSEHLDSLDVDLDGIGAELEVLRAVRDDLDGRIAAARALLDDLQASIEAGRAAHEIALSKVVEPAVLEPMTDDGAADGLARLLRLDHDRDLARLASDLSDWLKRSTDLLDQARTIEATNRAPVEARDELRGLLDAYRAKAADLGRLEDPQLEARYERAHRALFTAPTDLGVAAELVQAYREDLRGTGPARQVTS